ncbi:MAG TPA: hypothetical protein VGD69_14040 [Herpetosiphonaceae bacterium]
MRPSALRRDRSGAARDDAMEGGGFVIGPEADRFYMPGSATLHTPAVQQHQPIGLAERHEAELTFTLF